MKSQGFVLMGLIILMIITFLRHEVCCDYQPISFGSKIDFNSSNRFTLMYEKPLIVWPLHQVPAISSLSFESLPGPDPNSTRRYHALSAAFLCYVSDSTTAESYILSVVVTGVLDTGASPERGMIVWMANRDHPAVGGNPRLGIKQEPQQQGLADYLVLEGGNGEVVWRVNASDSQLKLSGDGNLLLYHEMKKEAIWQSFDYPSDTIVMGQVLSLFDNPLVSRASATDLSSGSYTMVMRPDSRLVFSYAQGLDSVPYLSEPAVNDWCNTTQFMVCAILDFSQGLTISLHCSKYCSQNSQSPKNIFVYYLLMTLSNDSIPIIRLQPNGDLYASIYSGFPGWISLQSFLNTKVNHTKCSLPLHCNRYTTCFPSNETCTISCITDSGESCLIETNHQPGPNLCEQASSSAWKMSTITGRTYLSNDNIAPTNGSSADDCKDLCFHNCSCTASFYDPLANGCFLITTQLLHLTYDPDSSYLAFIKMPLSLSPPLVNTTTIQSLPGESMKTTSAFSLSTVVAVVVSGTVLLSISITAVLMYRKCKTSSKYKKRMPNQEEDSDDNEFLRVSLHAVTRYSSREIQSMTNDFASVIGRGAFGCVYEGLQLSNQEKVAVKVLDNLSHQGTKEFRAEVAVMAGISHWNLVKLCGFCVEGFHKILVYELMPNGSLDSWLFRSQRDPAKSLLTWAVRFQIAVGVAKGLSYLHEGCSKKIIHLDIKPQNILLDNNFNAKVGDFGLSRLMSREESFTVTTMRGTPGYLAPEWLLNGGITDKIDVYSFGMVLLELVSGRKNYIPELAEEDKRYFPAWAFKKVKEGKDMELLDPILLHVGTRGNVQEEEESRRVMKVAFLCIQEDPQRRPRMSSIVTMLEGEEKLDELNGDDNIHGCLQTRLQIALDTTSSINPISLSLSTR